MEKVVDTSIFEAPLFDLICEQIPKLLSSYCLHFYFYHFKIIFLFFSF